MVKRGTNEIDKHIGQKIREARSKKGFTQEKLGEHLELTFQQIQKYEKGANRVSASRLYLISKFLNQPLTYFFNEPEEHWPETPDKDFITWLAFYNQLPKFMRKNYLEMGKNLVRLSEENQS